MRGRKKPSIAAYALNQVARKFPDDVAELVDVGRALARAQRKALRGDAGDDLRAAITRQRETLRSLVRKVSGLLRELGVADTHLGAITGALQTALVDPAAGEALEEGRLAELPETPTDFLGDLSSLPSLAPARKEKPAPKEKKPEPAPKRDLAAEKRKAREEERAAAQQALEEKRAAAEKAKHALLMAEAKRLRAEANEAAAQAKAAAQRAEHAETVAARAELKASRT